MWTRNSGFADSRRTTSWTSGRTPTGTARTNTCFPLHAKQLTKWVNGGGKVGLGSHGEVQGIGTHWELWMMASGGMKLHAALKAATIDSANAIGFAKDLGSLEIGKLADLIVLDANPLDDLKNTAKIAEVMKNGRLYDAATLAETYRVRRHWNRSGGGSWIRRRRRRPSAAGRSLTDPCDGFKGRKEPVAVFAATVHSPA